jgi:hypothetical protein
MKKLLLACVLCVISDMVLAQNGILFRGFPWKASMEDVLKKEGAADGDSRELIESANGNPFQMLWYDFREVASYKANIQFSFYGNQLFIGKYEIILPYSKNLYSCILVYNDLQKKLISLYGVPKVKYPLDYEMVDTKDVVEILEQIKEMQNNYNEKHLFSTYSISTIWRREIDSEYVLALFLAYSLTEESWKVTIEYRDPDEDKMKERHNASKSGL